MERKSVKKTEAEIRAEIAELEKYLARRTLSQMGSAITVARRDALLWVLGEKHPFDELEDAHA